MLGQTQQPALPDSPVAQQAVPDAPRPQTNLPGAGSIAPGKGTTPNSNGDAAPPPANGEQGPGTSLPSSQPQVKHADDGEEPELPGAGEGMKAMTLRVQTNFVEVPFTVKNNKNQLVPGITWRDVRVYENGLRQKMAVFTVDPIPLSVALVIDQSVSFQDMTKINNALGSLQGAFSTSDEVAVFTYNNGPRMQTDFTAAQSARLSAVLERSKSSGRDGAMNYTSGPLSQNINLNNGAMSNTMPLVNPTHGTSQSSALNVPREVHTLNDAILEAAKATTRAGPGRRRIVYVITDGKEYGSTAKTKDVIKYLQTNKITVFGTLIHSFPSVPGTGFVDKIHLPFQMRDNILPVYTSATGGQTDPEFRQKGIETSFAKIAEEVRTMYTVGYYSHQPFIDGKYRSLDIRVLRPNLTVIAKNGYYPAAQDVRPVAAPARTAP